MQSSARLLFIFLLFLLIADAGDAAGGLSRPDAATLSELAPTGRLRVGIFSSATFESGFGDDLANYIGTKIGVPVETHYFAHDLKAFIKCAETGACDVIFIGRTPDREKLLQFSPPFMELENTYLVRGNSEFTTIDDLDRSGVSISVLTGSVVNKQLTELLHKATLRPSTISESDRTGLLAGGQIDAIAENADQLDRWARMVPGSRLIPGSFSVVDYCLATAFGRPAASHYLMDLVRDVVETGTMTQMIAARGLRGHIPAN